MPQRKKSCSYPITGFIWLNDGTHGKSPPSNLRNWGRMYGEKMSLKLWQTEAIRIWAVSRHSPGTEHIPDVANSKSHGSDVVHLGLLWPLMRLLNSCESHSYLPGMRWLHCTAFYKGEEVANKGGKENAVASLSLFFHNGQGLKVKMRNASLLTLCLVEATGINPPLTLWESHIHTHSQVWIRVHLMLFSWAEVLIPFKACRETAFGLSGALKETSRQCNGDTHSCEKQTITVN